MRLFLQKSVVSCLFVLMGIYSVFGQLTVDFSASDSSGCGNVTPIFQDLTTSPGNPIVSWEWDFGDGTPHAFIQNPAHIYSDTIGCFDIKLIVTTNNGTVDSMIKPNFICVYPDPVIGPISINPAQACLPAIMTFVASVTSPTPINTWLWDIPGSQLQYGQTVVDTFNVSGILDITLLVQDANGCFADTIFDNVVSVLPSPVANFTASTTSACAAPFTTNFSSTSTLNGGAVPAGTTYQWSFPGGIPANSTQQNPTGITYNSPGNFDVTLSILSPNGCTDTLTKTGFIGVGQVIAGINIGAVTCVGQPISLDGTGASSYTWDFDCDNTTNATGASTSVTYNAPGTYCVKVTASNGPGCNDDEQVQIVVNPSPTASFVVDRTIDCKVPSSPFLFDASASLGASTYTWTFGPGPNPANPFTTVNPQVPVIYSLSGFKTVKLITENASGCRDTMSAFNLIQVSEPNANFTADKTEGCLPINIAFTSTSISIDPIASYQWLVTPSAGTIPNPVPGISNPTVQFNNPGDYNVQLIVITQLGCRDTLVRTEYISLGANPQMGMIYADSVICINESIQFNSAFTDTTWQYAWDFNYTAPSFNIMSSLPNPLHAFSDTGLVSVGLIINNNGCRDTLIKDDLVFINGPKAAFTVDPTVACGLPAIFDITNNSYNAMTGNTTYAWYFNNMVTPYTPIVTKNPLQPPVDPPSPTYGGAPQQITIKLIVQGTTTGCVDSLKQTVVVGNPIANFTVPDQIICRNSDATFNITGANATNYEWYFGDSPTPVTSTGSTTHTYTTIDTFTVMLIAIDANSCRDTLIKPLHIRVTGPTPNFTSPDTAGCTPFTTSFVNTTVLYPGTTQSNVEWNFYNPNVFGSAGNNNPSHTFSPNGLYSVSIRVTDSDGCVGGWTKQQYISATFPDTQFAANDTVTCAGNLITFTPVIPGNTYTWSFGDSTGVTHITSGTGAIQHSFPAVGQYSVTLKVTDVNGCIDSLVKTNYITIESYTADFTGSPTSAACPPLATFFQDQSSGNIAGWEWVFGDNSANATLQNPGHIYTAAGNFDVSLVVTHVDGCQDTVTKPNFITLDGPIGSVTISDTTVCPGDTVYFTITTNNTASIFPELQAGNAFFIPTATVGLTTTNLQYVYTLPGVYPSKFLIQDPAGCSYTIPNVPNVTVYQPPIAAFDMTPPAGCTPLTVAFTNNSTPGVGQTGGGTLSSYSWNFDNNGNSSTLQNPPSQTYMTPNVYNVSLFVTDSRGCSDTLTQALPANYRPLANFTADDTIQCAPVQIQFNDLTSITVPVTWSWNFGDNGTATTANPNHLYQQDGNYTITLVVTDANGCMDTFTRSQYVYLRHPVAGFVADSLYGCNPFEACFDASSTQSDTLIDTYNWQFGLGQGSQLSNADSICRTYSVPGTYTVTLTVTDVLGCADDLVRTNYITIDQTTTPDTMEILTATVVNRNKVRVDFIPYFQTDFRKYLLYRKTPQGWLVVDSTTIQTTSTLFDEDTTSFDCEALSYCYAMVVENDCRKRSPISMNKAHCTMQLSTGPQTDAVKLTWTHYKGWDNVLQYDIYKIPAGHIYYPNINNMVLLGSVAGNINTFQDTTTFCEDSVHYRIVAKELAPGSNQQESFSDVDGNKAKHYAPTEGVEMQYVTVAEDKEIDIKWVEYPGYKPAYYVLERSLGGDVWKEIETNIPLTTLTYTDTDVYVDSISYRYRVFADDSCGYRSRPYNIGRSIVLDANQLQDETPVLTWNAYEKWVDAGVEYYEIQVWDENNGWVMVDVVGPQTTRFVDTKTSLFQSIYNYRIIAHELAGYRSTSMSNEDSVIFAPRIWSANAFTPNKDGKNDVFVIKGPFDLSTFTLTIFDRWGRIIFESRDITQGWDGTVKGKDAPEGVYTYKVTAKGLKGEPVSQNGTVTLVR